MGQGMGAAMMGAYAVYVWSAVGVTVTVLISVIVVAVISKQQVRKKLRRYYEHTSHSDQ